MCDSPKISDATSRPAHLLLKVRDNKFCSKPRKRNSSGQAVKNKIPRATMGSERRRVRLGPQAMKWIRMPSGIAIAAKAMKLRATCQVEALAPFDRVADPVEPSQKHEGGDARAERHQNRERMGQLRTDTGTGDTSSGIRPAARRGLRPRNLPTCRVICPRCPARRSAGTTV